MIGVPCRAASCQSAVPRYYCWCGALYHDAAPRAGRNTGPTEQRFPRQLLQWLGANVQTMGKGWTVVGIRRIKTFYGFPSGFNDTFLTHVAFGISKVEKGPAIWRVSRPVPEGACIALSPNCNRCWALKQDFLETQEGSFPQLFALYTLSRTQLCTSGPGCRRRGVVLGKDRRWGAWWCYYLQSKEPPPNTEAYFHFHILVTQKWEWCSIVELLWLNSWC